METTLIMLKPDTLQRGLIGELISRFERKGLQVIGIKMARLSPELARRHYHMHRERVDFDGLIEFMTSGPVVILAIRGKQAISACRKLIGATTGTEAQPGTIRGDYGMSRLLNLVHGADSPEAAQRELCLFFEDHELLAAERALSAWIYAPLDLVEHEQQPGPVSD